MANYYVRPKKTGLYGAGNGLNYDDAWNGIGNYANGINWSVVQPGDTIYLCDTQISEDLYIGGSGSSGNVITIRGDCPGHPFVTPKSSFHPVMVNRDYITFLNFTFAHFYYYGEGLGGVAQQVNGSTYISFEGCTFSSSGGGISAIDLWAGNDHWTIDNCIFTNFANGVYTHCLYDDGDSKGADYLTVSDCFFDNMYGTDAHAIGIQGGQGHLIEGNSTHNTGGAIQFYHQGDHGYAMGNHTIRDNFIDTTNSKTTGTGIAVFNNHESAISGVMSFVIEYNIIKDVYGAGVYMAGHENSPFKISNNVIYNTGVGYGFGIGVLCADVSPTGEIYNNVVVNPYTKYITVSGNPVNYALIAVDNNLYFSNIGVKTWFTWDFATYKTTTGWDAHGLNVDPDFISDTPALAVDFTPNPLSPLVNAGFNYGQTADYFDNIVQEVPDIGAIEYQGLTRPSVPVKMNLYRMMEA